MPSFRLQCPECGVLMVVEIEPRERATREYPGYAANIYAEGCSHAETMDEDELWEYWYDRIQRGDE